MNNNNNDSKYYWSIKQIIKRHTEQSENYNQLIANPIGIYGIYCNQHLVYVGKSIRLFYRFCQHQWNTFNPKSKAYKGDKYVQLRRAVKAGAKISIKVLEYVVNESDLAQREFFYIDKYIPPLNTVINGGKNKKKVQSIRKYYSADAGTKDDQNQD